SRWPFLSAGPFMRRSSRSLLLYSKKNSGPVRVRRVCLNSVLGSAATGLQGAELVYGFLSHEPGVVVRGLVQLRLSSRQLRLDCALRGGGICIERRLREHRQPIRLDLREASLHEYAPRSAWELHVEHARAQHRKHGRMVRENCEVALNAGQHHLLRIL